MADADLVTHLQEWTSLVQSIRSDVVCDLERFRGVSECLSRSSAAKVTHQPRENAPSLHATGQGSLETSKSRESVRHAEIRNHVSDTRHQSEQSTSKGNHDEAHQRSWKEAVEEEDPAFPPAPPAPPSVSLAASAYGVSVAASKVFIFRITHSPS
jgi:hypothetical protein